LNVENGRKNELTSHSTFYFENSEHKFFTTWSKQSHCYCANYILAVGVFKVSE